MHRLLCYHLECSYVCFCFLYTYMYALDYLNQGSSQKPPQITDFLCIYDDDTHFYLCISVQEAPNDVATFNKLMNEDQQDGSASKGTCY